MLRHWGWISEETYWSVARWGGLVLMIAFNIPVLRGMIAVLVQTVAVPFLIFYGVIAG